MTEQQRRPVREIVSDLVACALIEGNEPSSLSAAAATKRVKQEALDEFERMTLALERIVQYCGNRGAAIQSVAHMARTALNL